MALHKFDYYYYSPSDLIKHSPHIQKHTNTVWTIYGRPGCDTSWGETSSYRLDYCNVDRRRTH